MRDLTNFPPSNAVPFQHGSCACVFLLECFNSMDTEANILAGQQNYHPGFNINITLKTVFPTPSVVGCNFFFLLPRTLELLCHWCHFSPKGQTKADSPLDESQLLSLPCLCKTVYAHPGILQTLVCDQLHFRGAVRYIPRPLPVLLSQRTHPDIPIEA